MVNTLQNSPDFVGIKHALKPLPPSMASYRGIAFDPGPPPVNRHQARAFMARYRKWHRAMQPRVARWIVAWGKAMQRPAYD